MYLRTFAKTAAVVLFFSIFLSSSCAIHGQTFSIKSESFQLSPHAAEIISHENPMLMAEGCNNTIELIGSDSAKEPAIRQTFSLDGKYTMTITLRPEDIGIIAPSQGNDLKHGDLLLWCYGAIHKWMGKFTYGGYRFDSSVSDPLQFKVTNGNGYVYIAGEGTVTTPEGKSLRFPQPAEDETQSNRNANVTVVITGTIGNFGEFSAHVVPASYIQLVPISSDGKVRTEFKMVNGGLVGYYPCDLVKLSVPKKAAFSFTAPNVPPGRYFLAAQRLKFRDVNAPGFKPGHETIFLTDKKEQFTIDIPSSAESPFVIKAGVLVVRVD